MIESHETERWVHGGVHHTDVETIDSLNRLPVLDRGTTERIGAHSNTSGANAVDVDDVGQIPDIRHEEIVGVCPWSLQSGLVGCPPDLTVAGR